MTGAIDCRLLTETDEYRRPTIMIACTALQFSMRAAVLSPARAACREAGVQSHVLPIDTRRSARRIAASSFQADREASPKSNRPAYIHLFSRWACQFSAFVTVTIAGGDNAAASSSHYSREYGLAKLRFKNGPATISSQAFRTTARWGKPGDSVEKLPIASRCSARRMIVRSRRCVSGQEHLRRAVPSRCHAQRVRPAHPREFRAPRLRSGTNWRPSSAETIEAIKTTFACTSVRRRTCCFCERRRPSGCVKVVRRRAGLERVHGVYVDTVHAKERIRRVMLAYKRRFRTCAARRVGEFRAVGRETNPESTSTIGVAFLAVENDVLDTCLRRVLLGQVHLSRHDRVWCTRESPSSRRPQRCPNCCGA